MTESVLVIDDQIGVNDSPEQRAFLHSVAGPNYDPRLECNVEFSFCTGNEGIDHLLHMIDSRWRTQCDQRWALVLLDVRFPDSEFFGFEILSAIRHLPRLSGIPVVILSSEDVLKSSTASRLRADGYLPKADADGEPLLNTERFNRALWVNGLIGDCRTELQLARTAGKLLRGRSVPHLECLRAARRLGLADQDGLLGGESGVGKTQLASYIHHWSGRNGRYVTWSANASNPDIEQTRLFGNWEFAYTGAGRARPGLLEQAHQGTFFLDEIANVPPSLQGALLSLRDKDREGRRHFFRLGSPNRKGKSREQLYPEDVSSDFLFLSGTNEDLERLTHEQNTFRSDLFYGLGHSVYCPPLNQRREDIGPIFHALLNEAVSPLVNEARAHVPVHPEVLDYLESLDWSQGNIRELARFANAAAQHFSKGFDQIGLEAFDDRCRRARLRVGRAPIAALQVPLTGSEPGELVARHLQHLKSQAERIASALERCRRVSRDGSRTYNYTGAAKWLLNDDRATPTDARRLLRSVIQEIFRPSRYWLNAAGPECFRELQAWFDSCPQLRATRKLLDGRKSGPQDRGRQ